jgi:RHS repeat-associated protein
MISPQNSSFKISVGIRNATDFSPFGVELKGRNFEVIGGGNYRYSFQGQESDSEVKGEGNSVNFKYRMHDSRLGRFFAVDPLAAKYAYNSPYAFSENMVIHKIELEGLESADYKMKQSYINLYKEINGGITGSQQDYVKTNAKERGFYLSSDIPILTNKPFSSYWALNRMTSAKDLSIEVMQDIHYKAHETAGANRGHVLHDAPGTVPYCIPEKDFVKILEPNEAHGWGMAFHAEANVTGEINNGLVKSLESNFQKQLLEVQRSAIQTTGDIFDFGQDYGVKIDVKINANTPQEEIDNITEDLLKTSESSGFKRENTHVNISITNEGEAESINMSSGNSQLIIPPEEK